MFRPHYVTWSEQQKIEFAAPEYLRNVIRNVTETGLRIYKELTPMKKDQLDQFGGLLGVQRQRGDAELGTLGHVFDVGLQHGGFSPLNHFLSGSSRFTAFMFLE